MTKPLNQFKPNEVRLKEVNEKIKELKKKLKNVKGTETEVFCRICGYYRSLRKEAKRSSWNEGQHAQFMDRTYYNKEKAVEKIKEILIV